MIIGIHPDLIAGESYSQKWAQFLAAQGVEVCNIDLLATDALEQACRCDGVMWRWAHNPQDKQSAQRILYTLEHYFGIPVYPDSRTAWHYDEKTAQFYLLQALNAPTPRTWVFWDRESALNWAKKASYPLVFKLSVGAGSANVIKVHNEREAHSLIDRAFRRGIFPMTMNEYRNSSGWPRSIRHAGRMGRRLIEAVRYVLDAEYPPLHKVWWKPEYGYAYFQEFLPGNEFDTRITVIGDRAFGFRRFNRPGDFRASGSGRIDHDPLAIDRKCIEIAFHLSDQGGFHSMAYDFLYRQGQPVVCEISYTYADEAVYNCPGRWHSDLSWADGHMWPEQAQVEDFLTRIRTVKHIS